MLPGVLVVMLIVYLAHNDVMTVQGYAYLRHRLIVCRLIVCLVYMARQSKGVYGTLLAHMTWQCGAA